MILDIWFTLLHSCQTLSWLCKILLTLTYLKKERTLLYEKKTTSWWFFPEGSRVVAWGYDCINAITSESERIRYSQVEISWICIRVTSASSEYNDTAPSTQFKITHLFHLVSYSYNILKWSEFMIRVSQMNKVNLVIQLIFVYVKSNCRLLTEGPLLIIYFVTGSKSPTSHLCFGNSGFNSMTGFGGSSTVTDWKAVKRASVRFQIQLHSPEMDLREKLT